MIIHRDELINAEDEIKELERLLNEASLRKRNILKKRDLQGWWDWFMEIIGY